MASSHILIVGLGNPGEKYHDTRHNIGFMLIDYLAGRAGNFVNKTKMRGMFSKVSLHGEQVLLLKPQTYMNRSGECVRNFVDYFDISVDNILIIQDDIDLPLGRVKAVAQGGAGGHNGIRSISKHLQTNNFSRLKVGVGRPAGKNNQESGQPVEKYVLSSFSHAEQLMLTEIEKTIYDAVGYFIEKDITVCMNHINGRDLVVK